MCVFVQGADVSAADYDLRTPLHIAARSVFAFESSNLDHLEVPDDLSAILPQILTPFHPQQFKLNIFLAVRETLR